MTYDFPEPGPLYTVGEAAKLIADKEPDVAHAANQMRRLAQYRAIEVRGQAGSGRTASNLFAVSDLAVAKINNILLRLGFSDRAVAEAVHLAAYVKGRNPTDENPNGHPITEALLRTQGLTPANVPALELRLEYMTTESGSNFHGQIIEAGRVYGPYEPSPDAAIIVPMHPWLPRFADLMNGK